MPTYSLRQGERATTAFPRAPLTNPTLPGESEAPLPESQVLSELIPHHREE